MTIFRLVEKFGQLENEMAKAQKIKADNAKVSSWVGRLLAARADRPSFEAVLDALEEDAGVSSAELIAIAHTYNKGGKKPTSKSGAVALIKKRLVEIVRFHAKNRVAEKVRPW
jgi:hypothetical protein